MFNRQEVFITIALILLRTVGDKKNTYVYLNNLQDTSPAVQENRTVIGLVLDQQRVYRSWMAVLDQFRSSLTWYNI